jgi:hypothetical protein
MKGDRYDTFQDIQKGCTAVLNAIPQKEYNDFFDNFSIDSSSVLIQETILNKKSEILKIRGNSRLVFLMNTVLTEPGHTVYIPLCGFHRIGTTVWSDTLQKGAHNVSSLIRYRNLY